MNVIFIVLEAEISKSVLKKVIKEEINKQVYKLCNYIYF